jgi:hypothetical protein
MLHNILAQFLLAIAIGCGGNVKATNGQASRDAASDAALDASADPFAAAGMKPLTSYEWASIQAEVCYQPSPLELPVDGGIAECSLVIAGSSSPGQSPYIWGCPLPDFVFTLRTGLQYLIQTATDCSIGGVIQDPSNVTNGVVICPATCSLVEQSGGGTLEAFVFCGMCPNP